MKPDLILFPDASLIRAGKDSWTGYGCVLLNPRTMKYTVIKGALSKKCTVPFGEAWAIYRGVQAVAHLRSKTKIKKILIVSDSKNTVYTYNVWITHSWHTDDWYHWTKRDHTPVKNQKIYRETLDVLSRADLTAKFVHINSHSDEKGKVVVNRIRHKMEQAGIQVTEDNLKVFIDMNAMADRAARDSSSGRRDDEKNFDTLKWRNVEEVEE